MGHKAVAGKLHKRELRTTIVPYGEDGSFASLAITFGGQHYA